VTVELLELHMMRFK